MNSSSEPVQLARRWKWRLRLPFFVFTAIVLLDCIAVSLGFSLHTAIDAENPLIGFYLLVFYVNLPGFVTEVAFGNPLADPGDQLAQQWNVFCFLAGGVATYVFFAFVFGWLLDWKRNLKILSS